MNTIDWGEWEDSEACPVSCGAGSKKQKRDCLDGTTIIDPRQCGKEDYLRTVDCRAPETCISNS